MTNSPLGWIQIVRLGLIQACIGSIVVLTTSTLNRVMVVEMALPALVPGLLVALHYAVQILRPRMGYGSDTGGRRTPWIVGGMAVLAAGGTLAAVGTAVAQGDRVASVAILTAAFLLIGLGVSACGTSLLVLLATHVQERRRPAAATVVWIMMIAGFAVTAGVAGHLLDPFSAERLVGLAASISSICFVITAFAIWNIEQHAVVQRSSADMVSACKSSFKEAMQEVWADGRTRRFTVFVFLSMLAYSAQDLILEPFAGSVLGYTPGESTALSGLQHSGVLVGMVAVALGGSAKPGAPWSSLRTWVVGGCLGSAVALAFFVCVGLGWPASFFKPAVFALGVANGAFAIAAVGSMMNFASTGVPQREGTRMGLWGAAQAIAFALGGVLGAGAADLARWAIADSGAAYASVFAVEAVLFVIAAAMALRVWGSAGAATPRHRRPVFPAGAAEGG
jgi:MFS transporter, BCD family, chlorophyll transporter